MLQYQFSNAAYAQSEKVRTIHAAQATLGSEQQATQVFNLQAQY